MDIAKKTLISKRLIFLFLILFPFGQIIKINRLHPIDLVAGISLLFLLVGGYKKPKIFDFILAFLGACLFSYIFSLAIFRDKRIYIGGLYLLRLFAYSAFFLIAWNVYRSKKKLKETLFNSLILVIFVIALFGLIQYFFYPDIRSFTVWGWDDHLYRLFATFLDPGFASILLIFGLLAVLVKYLKTKDRRYFYMLVILFGSIALTYSRAGYLALIGGLLTILFLKKKIKYIFLLLGAFLLIVLFLPRPASEGVKLERTFSIFARLDNYSETIRIAKKSPLLGIGFNNICLAREKFWQKADFESHACSGSDSSLLLVLATTGMVGLLIFLTFIYKLVISLDKNIYGMTFLACLVALLIHSLFVNSLFYPWVMGWMALLLSISLKKSRG